MATPPPEDSSPPPPLQPSPRPASSPSATDAALPVAQLRLAVATQLFPGLPVPAATDLGLACGALGISRADVKRTLQRLDGQRLLLAALEQVPELGQARAQELVRHLHEAVRRERMWNLLAMPTLMVTTFTVVSCISNWARNR